MKNKYNIYIISNIDHTMQDMFIQRMACMYYICMYYSIVQNVKNTIRTYIQYIYNMHRYDIINKSYNKVNTN